MAAAVADMADMDRAFREAWVGPTSKGRRVGAQADISGGNNCSTCSICSRIYGCDVRRCKACTSRNIHLA